MYATVVVKAEGFATEWMRPEAVEQGKPAIQSEYVHDFRLAEDRPIVGRVVDTDDRPVVGAKVSVQFIWVPPGGAGT